VFPLPDPNTIFPEENTLSSAEETKETVRFEVDGAYQRS